MKRYTWKTGVLQIIMIGVVLVVLVPVYILVNTALKPRGDRSSPLIPTFTPEWGNFPQAWEQASLGPALLNSAFVTVTTIVLLVAIGSLAAYPLARITANWSPVVYYAFMLGFIVPSILALIPLYSTFRDMGLLANPVALVILYLGERGSFTIFLYTEFLRAVPREYDEAASIDGAGRWKTFWHVILPMLRPVTGTVIILNAVFLWNDFYAPLLFLSGSGSQTLPVAMFSFTGTYEVDWTLMFAALIIGSLPMLIAFLAMQKAVFRGYASGLKG
jgi:raffinose/stachyose/melibiose transport system permease protein